MEIGDLVVLSAYGKKIKMLKEFRGQFGILISKYSVMWTQHPNFICPVNRKDIKKLK